MRNSNNSLSSDYTFIVENLKSGNVDHGAYAEAKISAIKKFLLFPTSFDVSSLCYFIIHGKGSCSCNQLDELSSWLD